VITGDSTVADEMINAIYDKRSLEALFVSGGGKRGIEFVDELPKTISGKIKLDA
jgi:acyl-coenzyme A synthetase/AMP-(fatty) acid ligase